EGLLGAQAEPEGGRQVRDQRLVAPPLALEAHEGELAAEEAATGSTLALVTQPRVGSRRSSVQFQSAPRPTPERRPEWGARSGSRRATIRFTPESESYSRR